MRKNIIHDAMDMVNPTGEQRERMREGILSRLPAEKKPARRTYQAKQAPTRRWSWIPAAAALFAVVLIGVFVLGQAGTHGAELAAPEDTVPAFTSRSLQDFFESGQYKAIQEWNAYLKTQNESNDGLAAPYPDYGCSSVQMQEKLDALCEKYGLSLKGGYTVLGDYEKLLDIVSVDSILRSWEGVIQNVTDFSNGYYPDGSFAVEGQTLFGYSGTPWMYPITFSFYRLLKTTFYDVLLDIGDITQYDYWEYTTQSGVDLLLAQNEDQALILADRGDYVILILTEDNRVGDIKYGEISMDKVAMEAFAETFVYVDGDPTQIQVTAVATAQMQIYSMPSVDSQVVGTVEKGARLPLKTQESVNGKKWGRIIGDNTGYPTGWVELENVEMIYDSGPTGEETVPTGESASSQKYMQLLDKYVTAIQEGWSAERYAQEDMSIILRDISSLDSLGYAITDLDGNGVEELILALDEESQTILDLYTLVDGELVHVLSGWERNSYFLREGGLILNIGTESGSCTNYVFNRFSGGELIQEEIIRFDALRDIDNPWFMGSDLHPVTQQEAEAAISAHTIDRIPLTLLSQMQ